MSIKHGKTTLKAEHLGYSKMAGISLHLAVEPLPLLADATGADEGIRRDDRGSETELAKGAEAGPECLRFCRT